MLSEGGNSRYQHAELQLTANNSLHITNIYIPPRGPNFPHDAYRQALDDLSTHLAHLP